MIPLDPAVQKLLDTFTLGWFETIEYTQHGVDKIEDRWQKGLIQQLSEFNHQVMRGRKSSEGGGGSKPLHPPMPISVEADELLGDIMGAMRNRQWGKLAALKDTARRFLDYDAGTMHIAGTVCHKCGGALVVARDASTSVRCTGTIGLELEPCGQEYERSTWIALLGGGQ